MNKEVLARAVSYIDSWLSFRSAKSDVPGFVVAIAHEGQLVLNRGYGYANLERREPMTENHVFRIASHSKTFTATAVMQLSEKGLLEIDKPVASYLPWLIEHADERMHHITARQLMSHTAGVIRDGLECGFWDLEYPFLDAAEFKQRFVSQSLVLPAGQQMKYSNIGFTLLGILIETVSGVSYNQYVSENIVDALDLHDTGPEISDHVLPRLVQGYGRRELDKSRLAFKEPIDTRALSAATGFYSTSADVCKYFTAHFVGSNKLLSDVSKNQMQGTQCRVKNTKDNEDYGLGFAVDYAARRTLFGHGGSFPGHRTKTMCDAAAKLVVTVMANCIDAESRTMCKGIYSIIDHFDSANAKTTPEKAASLTRFQGRFVSVWADVDIVEAGTHLIGIDPNSWYPFNPDQDIQRLEVVDNSTLRIASAHGYSSEGEEVKFSFDENDNITSIMYAGSKMKPTPAFVQEHACGESDRENPRHLQQSAQATAT